LSSLNLAVRECNVNLEFFMWAVLFLVSSEACTPVPTGLVNNKMDFKEVKWIGFTWLRIETMQALANTVMKLRVP
jgi:hypothetical protein